MCSRSTIPSPGSRVTPITSKRISAAPIEWRFGEPGAGEPAELQLFARADGVSRTGGTARGAEPAGLDLDEDQGVRVAGDQVDLAEARPGVAGEDLAAEGGETLGGDLFAERSGS